MTRRWHHPPKAAGDPHQLPIDWNEAATPSGTTPPPAMPEANAASPQQAATSPSAKPSSSRPPRKASNPADRIIARLPVPRPRPASVAAGHFGQDEDGKAIRPQADEIRAITQSFANRLIDLLDAMEAIPQGDARQAMHKQFTDAINMYALEFGERPARQLEAYVRHQASIEESSRDDAGWQR